MPLRAIDWSAGLLARSAPLPKGTSERCTLRLQTRDAEVQQTEKTLDALTQSVIKAEQAAGVSKSALQSGQRLAGAHHQTRQRHNCGFLTSTACLLAGLQPVSAAAIQLQPGNGALVLDAEADKKALADQLVHFTPEVPVQLGTA